MSVKRSTVLSLETVSMRFFYDLHQCCVCIWCLFVCRAYTNKRTKLARRQSTCWTCVSWCVLYVIRALIWDVEVRYCTVLEFHACCWKICPKFTGFRQPTWWCVQVCSQFSIDLICILRTELYLNFVSHYQYDEKCMFVLLIILTNKEWNDDCSEK